MLTSEQTNNVLEKIYEFNANIIQFMFGAKRTPKKARCCFFKEKKK